MHIARSVLFAFYSIVIITGFAFPSLAAAPSPYVTEGDCDGFPGIHLQTKPGICVGLIASGLGFPRGVYAVGSDIYIADMGGWRKGHGRLLRLRHNGHSAPEVLLDHLDEPNSLAPAPFNELYISTLGKIMRVNTDTLQTRDIVINLPDEGRHSLPAFIVAGDGSMFINVGSATDNCENEDDSSPDPKAPCRETLSHPPRGSIIHVSLEKMPVDASGIDAYASGLRNSMALVRLPSGGLYTAVNARDAINKADPSLSDEESPHDTFDKIEQGRDYGWPYCYDDNRPSPEYKNYDCTKKQAPTLLLPPHAAPLGMLLYTGHFLPDLDGKLIIGYHGYRAKGHRIVTLGLDKNGMPLSPPVDFVTGWGAQPANHPQGAPVTLFELKDGSILVTEDQNGTLLRISRNAYKKK